MSNPIAVVAEAQADFDVATKLIDETLVRTVDWVSETDIDAHRAYVGRTDDERFISWDRIDINRGNDYRRAVRRSSAGRSRVTRFSFEFSASFTSSCPQPRIDQCRFSSS